MKEEWEVSILLALFLFIFAGIIHHRGKEDTELLRNEPFLYRFIDLPSVILLDPL